MSVEKSANPEKLSDLNPFAVLINKAMMITTRVTITPTPWNGTSTSRTHISSSHTARICSRRMNGLYGNAFARANPDAVRRATARIDPPTITHVIAMAAPSCGRGRYRVDEIDETIEDSLVNDPDGDLLRDDDASIARWLDSLEALSFTPEEEAAWQAARREQRDWEKSRFDARAERLKEIFE
jgi:hypothetical protein